MAAEPVASAGLPAIWTFALAVGGALSAVIVSVMTFLTQRGRPAVDTASKDLAVAIASPIGDSNQMRLVLESCKRAEGLIDHQGRALDEILEGQERAVRALARQDTSIDRALSAISSMQDAIRNDRRPSA